MEIIAQTKGAKISPRKARLIADTVRNTPLLKALDLLTLTHKRAAYDLYKTLQSALSNATQKNIAQDGLYIYKIEINEGPSFKRYHYSTRGRIHPYKKRTSHIKVILKQKEEKSVETTPKVEEKKKGKEKQK